MHAGQGGGHDLVEPLVDLVKGQPRAVRVEPEQRVRPRGQLGSDENVPAVVIVGHEIGAFREQLVCGSESGEHRYLDTTARDVCFNRPPPGMDPIDDAAEAAAVDQDVAWVKVTVDNLLPGWLPAVQHIRGPAPNGWVRGPDGRQAGLVDPWVELSPTVPTTGR
jgi:hypothetical protein